MSWYKKAQDSRIVAVLTALLMDVNRGGIGLEQDRISQIASMLPNEQELSLALNMAITNVHQTELTPQQQNAIEQIQNAFYSSNSPMRIDQEDPYHAGETVESNPVTEMAETLD